MPLVPGKPPAKSRPSMYADLFSSWRSRSRSKESAASSTASALCTTPVGMAHEADGGDVRGSVRSPKSSLSKTMEDILSAKPSSELKREFYRHLLLEHSPEHLEFLFHVELYKSEFAHKSTAENRARAEFIFHHFCDSNGPSNVVNISSALLDELKSKFTGPAAFDQVRSNDFDKPEKEIRILLELDTLPRFMKSDGYVRLHTPSVSFCDSLITAFDAAPRLSGTDARVGQVFTTVFNTHIRTHRRSLVGGESGLLRRSTAKV